MLQIIISSSIITSGNIGVIITAICGVLIALVGGLGTLFKIVYDGRQDAFALKGQVQQLEVTNTEKSEQLKTLTLQIKAEESKAQDLADKITHLQTEAEKSNHLVSKLRGELDVNNAKLKENNAKVKEYEQQIQKLNEQIELYRQELTVKQAHIEQQNIEAEKIKARIVQLEQQQQLRLKKENN